jgi:hypothetical protein
MRVSPIAKIVPIVVLVNQQHQLALFERRAGCWSRSSYKGRTANALALEADEGRGYLR